MVYRREWAGWFARRSQLVQQPWNNAARLSLSIGLYAWVIVLVTTLVASVAFIDESAAARVVFGGFMGSHAVVFTLPYLTGFALFRGDVSLLHVVFWLPGWLMAARGFAYFGNAAWSSYELWTVAVVVVVGVSLAFDVLDAICYLNVRWRRRAESGVRAKGQL